MKTNPHLLDGIIIFESDSNTKEVIPELFEYPKHFKEYCQNIEENQYEAIVFTDQNNCRWYGHLYGLTQTHSILIFSHRVWITCFRYLMNIIKHLYIDNKPLFYQTINYLIRYNIQPSTSSLYYPDSQINFQFNNINQSIETDAFSFLSKISENTLRCLFASILNERRVVIIGQNPSEFSVVVLLLLEILIPFEWQHIIITHLPVSMVSLLQSPLPFIIGMKTNEFTQMSNEVVVFNIDTLTIQATDIKLVQTDIDSFPIRSFNILYESIKRSITLEKREQRNAIKSAFSSFLFPIYSQITKYITLKENLNTLDAYFDEHLYIRSSNDDIKQFLKAFMKTTLMQQYIEITKEDYIRYPVPSKIKN
ncbi:denn domain-containing protein, putative [Entamoeba dispar SAW760]|uniref:Denn domain-containing protein, putative n=1 Tax=Entamoeba dispar (strain ATCC PRA-260 / SAW760) TaxID=370354 RepID=B0ECZ3_ENTDS|nr:denn domain-containing protein, putative [Entamoeba dispar SAW760]EDR27601.1 denn domain-containing protein, putative [Entamoeba dispar SAW760]|eukprot:EDR27601.1 denn domain-containing protein, putative [Entamoeba dispar SAW760]